ncbi:uncharacterized protein LOC108856623 isoform X2 [Raphanus sativus]|uniref:Uncharacterized protein LOC108856623 isoform X2 n=1 Tax=Raphanus sativus TaxID=3726 RepID=A0A6J0NN91_RAPSA|nr:uncharacterized protein LOC108856623 isoform X2 [Raphanus sativus]
MASSKVSCMLVSLLLLVLVLSDMDKALGEPFQLRNRKLMTDHHDQVTTDRRLAVTTKRVLFRKPNGLVGVMPKVPDLMANPKVLEFMKKNPTVSNPKLLEWVKKNPKMTSKILSEWVKENPKKTSEWMKKNPNVLEWVKKNPKKASEWVKKIQDLMGAIPPPPPSSECEKNDDECKRLVKEAKAKSPLPP